MIRFEYSRTHFMRQRPGVITQRKSRKTYISHRLSIEDSVFVYLPVIQGSSGNLEMLGSFFVGRPSVLRTIHVCLRWIMNTMMLEIQEHLSTRMLRVASLNSLYRLCRTVCARSEGLGWSTSLFRHWSGCRDNVGGRQLWEIWIHPVYKRVSASESGARNQQLEGAKA